VSATPVQEAPGCPNVARSAVRDEELAILRGEVRRVGGRLHQARSQLSRVLDWILVLAFPFFLLLEGSTQGQMHSSGVLLAFISTVFLVVFGGKALTIALAGNHHRRIRSCLRQRLAALTPEQRTQVLMPLWQESGDTLEIVEPLIRELPPISGELIPCAPPASDHELSPADPTVRTWTAG
jgi:hypothetical protein